MKAVFDPDRVLAGGLAAIRDQFHVPHAFPPDVIAAAEAAASRTPAGHVDRTGLPLVTLDPASSTDLDQAFAIEASGGDLLLRYAIADVAWFVDDDDPIDREAWRRGATLYLPDGKAGLYPPVLSEGAASLLPDGPRPAVLFTVRVAPDGEARLEAAERALVRSRAKLAYETADDADLPPQFAELARRIALAEARRGAARVDPPEQEVVRRPDGGYALAFRARHASEARNAALSLATNLAIAELLQAHHTGLFRVMAEPDAPAISRLRNTARALGIAWPEAQSLVAFRTGLDPADPHQAALMLAIRRAGQGASYAPWRAGTAPWHAAVAAPYVHATAPLRRLADRYVIRAALAVMAGQPVPPVVGQAFERLPKVMGRADAVSGQIDRAVVDLAEAVMLAGREGEEFAAIVTDVDVRGARMQLADLPIVTRIDAPGAAPGTPLRVRLVDADPADRAVRFEAIGAVP
ncbi:MULTISPECIES: RNB domain-containing ribonuclease [unclassified Sphingomonas]|uniref:RNB domain-containing ribonuclease n=1 Tax=Sphingomonas TaxID=13687 RepID=UPI0009621170|nr:MULTISPECIES: RNB domain-containing ribonuclease [unclassified Sphingomonas]MBN8813043.1 RNB domain-containing ribonuclease [Sphingomonas sp.]OJY54228.1 MAG: RNB domain-containing ribonuclease [Sphingomonas sp. 67-41]